MSRSDSTDCPAVVGEAPKPPARRAWRFRLMVLVVGGLVGLLVAEVGYRIKLAMDVGELPVGIGTTFHAWSEATVVEDPVSGYRHHPHRDVVGVRVVNGRAVLVIERTTNEAGAVGAAESRFETAGTRVLVVGDSFSEIQRGGSTWPMLLERELDGRLPGVVAVVNRARSGHGVMQMLETAVAEARNRRYNVIVVALITDDLNRSRFWQKTIRVDGDERLETRLARHDAGWLSMSEFYDERIDAAWCRRVVGDGGTGDPLLKELVGRFASRKRDNPRRIDYASTSSSFLYNRLVFGDPFFGIEGIAATPRFSWRDFRRDAQLVRAVEELRALEATVVLVHLPQHEEMAAGTYLANGQQRALLTSLEQLVGVPVTSLIERGTVPVQPGRLFLLPHDHHPSQRGLGWYAEVVAGVLEGMATPAEPGSLRRPAGRDEASTN